MEFLETIFEYVPRPESHSLIGFILEHATLTTAIAVLILFPVEIVFRRWSQGWDLPKKTKARIELFGTFVLMFTLLLVVALGLYANSVNSIRKPQEIVWQDKLNRKLQSCLTGYLHLPKKKRDEIEERLRRNYETADLHCLADAVQKLAAAEVLTNLNAPPANLLRMYMRIADALLGVEHVRDILKSALSIDAQRFLGYGYSLSEQAAHYSDAAVREYFVRNICATPGSGPCADNSLISRQIFTWILDPAYVSRNPSETVGSILKHNLPEKTNQNLYEIFFKDIEASRLKKPPPLLIRFGKFPKSKYIGTVGRPDATYVFFSDLATMWNKGIADAESDSGRIGDVTGAADQQVYIWVYYTSSKDDFRIATWENVMYLLKQIRVDPDIANLAE